MAQSRVIRIHQYLDDWLIRAPTKEFCHQGTHSLHALCQELGWVVNLQKSELEPKQVFEFVGYQYNLLHGLVKPTQYCWESILQKMESVLSNPTCRVRKLMSLIGRFTAMAKQKTLEGPRITGKGDSSSKDSPPAPTMVDLDQGDKCLPKPDIQVPREV